VTAGDMKSFALLFACTFALIASASAQIIKGPAHFADIPWGVPKAELKARFSLREGVKFETDVPKLSKTVYVGGNLSGYNVTKWHFWFNGDKFGEAMAEFMKSEAAFPDLKQKLTAQYGDPKTQKTKRNEAVIVWEFPASGKVGATKIFLQVKRDDQVRLIYRNLQIRDSVASGIDTDL